MSTTPAMRVPPGVTRSARTDEPRSDPRGPEILAEVRGRIDEIDERLVELLGERCRLARALTPIKGGAGLPLTDPSREAAVVRRAGCQAREAGLEEEAVRRIYWSVIELSREAQR